MENVIQTRISYLKSRKTPSGQYAIEFRGTSRLAGFLTNMGYLDVRGKGFWNVRNAHQAKKIIAENWHLFDRQ